jgi:hypothetical protein
MSAKLLFTIIISYHLNNVNVSGMVVKPFEESDEHFIDPQLPANHFHNSLPHEGIILHEEIRQCVNGIH